MTAQDLMAYSVLSCTAARLNTPTLTAAELRSDGIVEGFGYPGLPPHETLPRLERI